MIFLSIDDLMNIDHFCVLSILAALLRVEGGLFEIWLLLLFILELIPYCICVLIQFKIVLSLLV